MQQTKIICKCDICNNSVVDKEEFNIFTSLIELSPRMKQKAKIERFSHRLELCDSCAKWIGENLQRIIKSTLKLTDEDWNEISEIIKGTN